MFFSDASTIKNMLVIHTIIENFNQNKLLLFTTITRFDIARHIL